MFKSRASKELVSVKEELRRVSQRSRILDEACGIGLWDAVLFKGDAMHAGSRWTWSAEFRRLIGFEDENSFPNVVQSWSERLHPDDVASTFAAFGKTVTDRSGETRYDVTYRLTIRDGSYRWFRATGGAVFDADGQTVLCCGSLTDVHEQVVLKQHADRAAEEATFTIACERACATFGRRSHLSYPGFISRRLRTVEDGFQCDRGEPAIDDAEDQRTCLRDPC